MQERSIHLPLLLAFGLGMPPVGQCQGLHWQPTLGTLYALWPLQLLQLMCTKIRGLVTEVSARLIENERKNALATAVNAQILDE